MARLIKSEKDIRLQIDDKISNAAFSLAEAVDLIEKAGLNPDVIEALQVAIEDIQIAREEI